MKPRTLCGCQPVVFMISFRVTRSGRLSRSSTLAVLLPSRALAFWRLTALGILGIFAPYSALDAFFVGEVFFPDLPLADATGGFCWRPVPGSSDFLGAWLMASAALTIAFCSV